MASGCRARYLLRPVISADRLALRADGRVEYKFRKPDPTGRTSWVTDGPTWCRRLATMLPPRRGHTARFHGVLTPWTQSTIPLAAGTVGAVGALDDTVGAARGRAFDDPVGAVVGDPVGELVGTR
jgi:hypothetical protein